MCFQNKHHDPILGQHQLLIVVQAFQSHSVVIDDWSTLDHYYKSHLGKLKSNPKWPVVKHQLFEKLALTIDHLPGLLASRLNVHVTKSLPTDWNDQWLFGKSSTIAQMKVQIFQSQLAIFSKKKWSLKNWNFCVGCRLYCFSLIWALFNRLLRSPRPIVLHAQSTPIKKKEIFWLQLKIGQDLVSSSSSWHLVFFLQNWLWSIPPKPHCLNWCFKPAEIVGQRSWVVRLFSRDYVNKSACLMAACRCRCSSSLKIEK